ncbi:MAG: double-strand break repair protein AddB [Rhodospirillales bacterium]|nr:double-strand break repair protein AddB [Rhodospirillales bacterium]MBO6785385.1 double-strand break repair protein AddB [Rhodospirillales bacterium]
MFDFPAPRVATISSDVAFVDALAARLLTQADGDPMALAEMRILLPTRRACRALAEAFLRLSGGSAQLLPTMTPLGDMDEEELSIAEAGLPPGASEALALLPAIPSLRRQLLLSTAVMALPDHRMHPEQATALALELAKLIDRLATENCNADDIRGLVDEKQDYAEHWNRVLRFLEILMTAWPDILAGEGCIDPAARRNALLHAQARLWQESPPDTPVIAAGSTGSIPATADLLAVIAALPKGMVILPGLDKDMPNDAWAHLGPTHPQFGLRQLLSRLDIERAAVTDFTSGTSHARSRLISAALTPAKAALTEPPSMDDIEDALAHVSRIDCPGPSEEAAVVALAMRRTLETPEKTCALVTPDRSLARRVAAQLNRWGLDVDDSAGQPLAQTPPGAFLRLVADACAEGLAPVPLLALLKHPMASGGLDTADFRSLVRGFEIRALRGPRPAPGIRGLRDALGDNPKFAHLRPLIDIVEAALAPLLTAIRADAADYGDVLKLHVQAAETLASDRDLSGDQRLWAGDDGDAAARFVAELAEAIGVLGKQPGRAYAMMFDGLMAGRVVRPRYGTHPRLHIWGLLEARLQHTDTVILGGLNEGTWPPEPESNPWMSRPMMADIGLEMPERRIGLTAHDFQQAFAAPEVILTRAERVGGAPTVPSRWLLRIDNLLARAGAPNRFGPDAGTPWLAWIEKLDEAARVTVQPPKPTPPLSARPSGLSVTQIETLIRDPYAIYARHVLGLEALDPLDADPGAAERGSLIHEALENFVRAYPDTVPDDAERRLLEIGEQVFAGHLARPGVRAFWWPRFERIARWFLDWQRDRLAAGWQVNFAEEKGKLTLDAIEGGFTITAKPDRIDFRPDVGLSIIDYKTGYTPTTKQVDSGFSPQLPLEAVMARNGAFKGVPAEDAKELLYIKLSGGRAPGELRPVKVDIPELIDKTMDGVNRLVSQYADPDKPYLSNPRPQFENRFSDYDHLARVAEWRGGGEEDA